MRILDIVQLLQVSDERFELWQTDICSLRSCTMASKASWVRVRGQGAVLEGVRISTHLVSAFVSGMVITHCAVNLTFR